MTDQTQSSEEETNYLRFEAWIYTQDDLVGGIEKPWQTDKWKTAERGYSAALSSQAEQIRKLEEIIRDLRENKLVNDAANYAQCARLVDERDKAKETISALQAENNHLAQMIVDNDKMYATNLAALEKEKADWEFVAKKFAEQSGNEQDKVSELEVNLAALQARIDEADGQIPFGYWHKNDPAYGSEFHLFEDNPHSDKDCKHCKALFTRPPIKSQRELELNTQLSMLVEVCDAKDRRELELLAVIEQKDNALLATGIKWPVVLEALALTPDMKALKDSEGWCPHGVSLHSHCTKCGF